jgi:urease accessory protein
MDEPALLAMLQLADSAFPSGAYTLSGGLETMVDEGVVRSPDDVAGCIRSVLLGRAARGDLAALVAAHRAASEAPPDFESIVAIDRRLEATKLATEERTGARRVGGRIAIEADRLIASPAVVALRAAIDAGETPGTAAVAFGVVAAGMAIPEREAALAAAHATTLGLLGVAVRLGRIGHGDQQRLLSEARDVIVQAVDVARATDWRTMQPFAPGLDVAMARHEVASGRMFAS